MRYPSWLPLHPARDVCWCCRIVEFEQLQENVRRRNYHVPLKGCD
jgi:hypothetical protein